MNRLCLYDTETTGLDPAKDTVVEVACAIYDIEHNIVDEMYSSLVECTHNEAEHVNQIPLALLVNSFPRDRVWSKVSEFMNRADAVVAHRVEFDQSFTPEIIWGPHQPGHKDYFGRSIPWVCSKFDIEWPNSTMGSGLVNIALEHGIGVVQAHRAMTDVDILARVFGVVSRYYGGPRKIRGMLERAMRPKVRVVSLAGFDKKDLVKSHGFTWRPGLKVWDRMMPQEDVMLLPFATRVRGETV